MANIEGAPIKDVPSVLDKLIWATAPDRTGHPRPIFVIGPYRSMARDGTSEAREESGVIPYCVKKTEGFLFFCPLMVRAHRLEVFSKPRTTVGKAPGLTIFTLG